MVYINLGWKQQFNLRTNLKLVTIKIFHILSFLWLFYKNALTLTFNLSFSFLSPMNPVMVWLDHRDLLFLTFPGTSILLSIVTGLVYIVTPVGPHFCHTFEPHCYRVNSRRYSNTTGEWQKCRTLSFPLNFKKRILIKAFNLCT